MKPRLIWRSCIVAGWFAALLILSSGPAAGSRVSSAGLRSCIPGVLYDQSVPAGTNATSSQDFESASDSFDSEAADDFIVPVGQTWAVQRVVAGGVYFNGAGPAESFNVTFYDDAAGLPGTPIAGGTLTNLAYTIETGSFTIALPSSVMLSSGIYWISVQAKMDFTPGGQWGWNNRTTLSGSPAAWQNPGGGFGIPACSSWAPRGTACGIDPASPDQLFQIIGTIEGGCSTATAFDYDGDRMSDISVFRPANAAWYLQRSQEGFYGAQFGISSDKIAPADYDGDGKTDIAVYRPSSGVWYIIRSSDNSFDYAIFGIAEDLPVPADYDGDSRADIAVFRPSSGTWYRQNSSNGTFFGVQFGQNGDKPTIGDFDGDGKSDIAVWRPSNGAWYRINSSNETIFGFQFGLSTDLITQADYDGDKKTDIAVFRPSNNYWYILNSSTGDVRYDLWGSAGDIPAPSDLDGDGKADICIFRPATGHWHWLNSGSNTPASFQFGTNGDQPTQTAFRY